MHDLDYYWNSIPIGRENKKSYQNLCDDWGMNKRMVRHILHRLSQADNGDGYVLVRSSSCNGFYRTNDRKEIERYRQEVYNRARHTFAPFKKINRILNQNENQLTIELL